MVREFFLNPQLGLNLWVQVHIMSADHLGRMRTVYAP